MSGGWVWRKGTGSPVIVFGIVFCVGSRGNEGRAMIAPTVGKPTLGMLIKHFRSFVLLVISGALLTTLPARGWSQQGAPGAATTPGVLVDSIEVRGNQRLEAANVRVQTTLEPGRRITLTEIQGAIRRLMAT